MSSIYKLTAEYLSLMEMAEDPDIDEQAFLDTLESIEGDICDKAEAYAIIIGEVTAKAAQLNSEAKRLTAWADSLTNKATRMKDALMFSMDAVGAKKIETDHFRFSIAGNGGKKPLKITGEVPEAYTIMKPEIDTKGIRDALEAGMELNFAHLEERGRHLNIR